MELVRENLDNEITNQPEEDIETKQNKFLESNFGKIVNTGIDVALRAILPNMIEDEIIGIKNVIINDGFKKGLNAAIEAAKNIGKSITGIFTGKFETVSQAYNAVKAGGIVDSTSKLIDDAVKSAQKNNLISNSTAKIIKKSKNIVRDCVTDKIESEFMGQVEGVEKIGKYIENWKQNLTQKDLERNEKRIYKNKKQLDSLIPLENTLNEVQSIENVQCLIKNKGGNLENITEEELQLAQTI